MDKVQITTNSTAYFTSLTNIANLVDLANKKVVVFASKHAQNIANSVINALNGSGANVYTYITSDGEDNKNINKALLFTQYLSLNDIEKNDLIINVGGGTICDLGGFVASVYMRGISYINLPTTLLCACDACIGGKTGIDANGLKNLWGTFSQPQAVIIDCEMLKSLPKQIITEGLSEIVKYALINGDFFNYLTKIQTVNEVINNLGEIVKYCVKIKAEYVQADEFDRGVRHALNLGHTVAHAVESASNYALSHAQAVAYGIVIESKIAHQIKLITSERLNKILNLAQRFLPLDISFNLDKLIPLMQKDKKNVNSNIVFSLPSENGVVIKEFSVQNLTQILKEIL